MSGPVPRRPRWSPARFRLVRALPPILTAALLAVALGHRWWTTVTEPEFAFRDGQRVRVADVLDGETLRLEEGVRVRLIGVDAPSADEPGGVEATRFLREAVEGRTIELRFDRERLDGHEHVLAYVFSGDDCLNASIIAAGRARLRRDEPFSSTRKRAFEKAEESARSLGLGVWGGSR